jgi:hypothetical protein
MIHKIFPTSVIEKIGYYVYTLADPSTNKIFYVGKGTGNRIFAHARAAIKNPTESDKLSKIRKLRGSGKEVKYEIIRHGLSESEALEVESALIDFIGLPVLTNLVAGTKVGRRGRMSISEIVATYRAEEITIIEPAILVIINRRFVRNISAEELYESTRRNWVLGERRKNAEYAFSVYRGLVREVYRITNWSPAKARSLKTKTQKRWRFEGEIAQDLQHYIGGSVSSYLKPGARGPVRYINC